jgi:hypothetical protein
MQIISIKSEQNEGIQKMVQADKKNVIMVQRRTPTMDTAS